VAELLNLYFRENLWVAGLDSLAVPVGPTVHGAWVDELAEHVVWVGELAAHVAWVDELAAYVAWVGESAE